MSAPEPVPYKVALDVVRQILQLGHELGLPVDETVHRIGNPLAPLPGQEAFVAGPSVERLLGVGLRLIQDPLPGLYAARLKAATVFGLAGFLVQTTSTVGALLDTLIRVEPLVGDSGTTRLRHVPGAVHLTWDCRFEDPYVRWHVADFVLATFALVLLPASRGGGRVVEAVHFAHAPPADPAQLRRYLDAFGCPAYFNQPESLLVLQPRALDLPMPHGDPQLFEVLEQHVRKVMEQRQASPSVLDLVRSQLHQLLQRGDASRERLAEGMGMTARTLHRKLQEAGTSYRELLDGLRLEKARNLLRDSSLDIQEVAQRAGFDESASFTRWFRLREGTTPSEFRQRGQAG